MSASQVSIEPATAQELENLVVFPLPSAVLFPHTILPLHIFEPRYRAMTHELIEHQRPLGVALLQPGYEDSYHDRPAIHDTIGVGRLVHHESLPDGRYNIILHGVSRARLMHEHPPTKPWRTVCAELMHDIPAPQDKVTELISTMRACLFGLGQEHQRLVNLIAKRLNKGDEPSALADSLLSTLLPDLKARQEALADTHVASRLERVNACISELLLHNASFGKLSN